MSPDYWLLLRLMKAAKSLLGQRSPVWCMKKKIYSHMLCSTALSGQHSALRLWPAKTNHTPDLISVLHKSQWAYRLRAGENQLGREGGKREAEWGPGCAISMCLVLVTEFLRSLVLQVDLLLRPFFPPNSSFAHLLGTQTHLQSPLPETTPNHWVTVSYLAILTAIETRCQVKF